MSKSKFPLCEKAGLTVWQNRKLDGASHGSWAHEVERLLAQAEALAEAAALAVSDNDLKHEDSSGALEALGLALAAWRAYRKEGRE